MSLIFEICEEIEDRGTVACKEPRLNFVSPHLVLARRKRTNREEKARQTESVVFASIFHYFAIVQNFRFRFLSLLESKA